jgi:hypothetical protein
MKKIFKIRGSLLFSDILRCFMTTALKLEPERNLVVVRYHGHVGPIDAQRYLEEARAALPNIQPGFRLLADLTDLETMEVSCAPYIRQIMDLFNEKGIASVVRVIPDPTLDIGLQIMSLFHYGHNVRIMTCATLEEAMRALE